MFASFRFFPKNEANVLFTNRNFLNLGDKYKKENVTGPSQAR